MLIVLLERMVKMMLDVIKVFTYTVYAFVVIAVGLVGLVAWDIMHGG